MFTYQEKPIAVRRGKAEGIAETPQCSRQTSGGRTYPVQRAPISVFNRTPHEEHVPHGMQYAEQPKPHVAHNSGKSEWYTPREYVEAARQVMGGIDLDPASCEIANRVVQADRYYTVDSNGLAHPWAGRVWMNPPYARELIPLFCAKLKAHVESGDVEQATLLVNNATETAWFNTQVSIASAIVFPKSRVRFHMPDGKTGAPLQGQAVVYIGGNPKKFIEIFSQFGWGVFILEERVWESR